MSWRGPHHPNAGGAEISTHEHAKRWVREGHSVTMFTSYYHGAKKEESIDGVQIIRSGSQFLGVHINAYFWYLFSSHPDFDLVIDQFHGIPFFTPLYVKTKKMSFIHEVAKEVWRFNQLLFPLNLLIGFLGMVFEPLIFRLYTNVPFMTVSDSTKKDLMNWGVPERNITVIHNGVNIPEVEYKKERVKTITYLGALTKDKGIETALLTFSIIQGKSNLNYQFWIIGRGEQKYVETLRKKADKLGIRNLKMWGFVNDAKKFELLAKSYVLINTSIREGWGLVVIEAAGVGTPTVSFDVPGLRDSIINGETGILIKDMTAESLTKNLIGLLENNKMLETMSKNALSWSKKFSWDKSTTLSLNLIKEVAALR